MATFDISHAASLSSLGFVDSSASKAADLKISCLEVCGDSLYVGCENGMILVFLSESTAEGRSLLLSQCNSSNFKSTVTCLKAVSALNILLVLSGEGLFPLHMDSLEPAFNPKLKNVTTLCLNQNPVDDNPFQVQCCLGRKRSIQIALLTESEIKVVKEISVSHHPLALAMDGTRICAAVGLEYLLVDTQSKEVQPLFSRDGSQTAIVERTEKGEFLVGGPGNLGVFVLAEGFSNKPPISWKTDTSSVALHQPYLLTLSSNGISVYSLIDQQLKQSIGVPGLKFLVYGDGKIWASSETDIFGLVDFSWEVQLQKLLDDDRVEEALQLLQHVSVSTGNRDEHDARVRDLQRRVAFRYLEQGRGSEARELLVEGRVDIGEILSVLPDLLPSDSHFIPSIPESRALAEKLSCDSQGASQYRAFLRDYLRLIRRAGRDDQQRLADFALLRIYSQDRAKDLLALVTDCKSGDEESRKVLSDTGNYHALALLLESRGKVREALDLWTKLLDGELADEMFPGRQFVAQKISETMDLALVLRYSLSVLLVDPKSGTEIFKNLFRNNEVPVTSEVEAACNFLRDFPDVLKEFLEFLIHEKKSNVDKVHTDLALAYLDDLNCGRGSSGIKLRSLLRSSKCLNFAELQKKIDVQNYPHEYAIICGRLGDHEEALRMFLVQMKDFSAAAEYCTCTSDSRAWTSLVNICTNEVGDQFLQDLISLMSMKPQYFDATASLEALPGGTDINTLLPFIKYTLRESLHQHRSTQIHMAVSLAQLTESRYLLAREQRGVFVLQPSSFCYICKKNLVLGEKSAVTRFPNGVVAHACCVSHKNVCPVTGRLFLVEKTAD